MDMKTIKQVLQEDYDKGWKYGFKGNVLSTPSLYSRENTIRLMKEYSLVVIEEAINRLLELSSVDGKEEFAIAELIQLKKEIC